MKAKAGGWKLDEEKDTGVISELLPTKFTKGITITKGKCQM